MVDTIERLVSDDLCSTLDAIDRVATSAAVAAHLAELLEASRDPREFVRRAIADVLGTLPRHINQSRSHLIALATDPDAPVRIAAITSLGRLRDEHSQTLDVLTHALWNSPEDKTAAAVALGNVGSAKARQVLIDAVVCEYDHAATVGIRTAGSAVSADLRQAITQAPEAARWRLIALLFAAAEVSEGEILQFLDEHNDHSRSEVVRSLTVGNVTPPVFERLCEIIEERPKFETYSKELRQQILFLFRQMGAKAGSAVPSILRYWMDGDLWATHEALVSIGASSVPFLAQLLMASGRRNDREPRIILRVLRDIGEPAKAALPNIVEGLSAPTRFDRFEACLTLLTLDGDFRLAEPVLYEMLDYQETYFFDGCARLIADRIRGKKTSPELVRFARDAASRSNNWQLKEAVKKLER